ncbi:hypothetical protein D3C87_1306100 [compost metagenome]
MVLGVAVELHGADFDQRELAVWPDLGQVERVVPIVDGLLLFHDLNAQFPAREMALFDVLVQIPQIAFPVLADHHRSLGIGEVFDALLADEVKLHPHPLVVPVDQAESVAAEAVHVAETGGNTTITHDNRHLVQRLGQQRPEIPVAGGIAQAGARVTLDHVVEVRKTQRIAKEKHRGVVADDVPVAFVGVELHRETTDVALGVGGAAFTGHRGKTHEQRGLLAH